MSILDRVKSFLPEIKKANEELNNKIEKEGKESVIIDNNLSSNPINEIPHDNDNDNDIESDDDTIINKGDETTDNKNNNKIEITSIEQVIQIEFAIGDFDNSVIANLEGENNDNDTKEL